MPLAMFAAICSHGPYPGGGDGHAIGARIAKRRPRSTVFSDISATRLLCSRTTFRHVQGGKSDGANRTWEMFGVDEGELRGGFARNYEARIVQNPDTPLMRA